VSLGSQPASEPASEILELPVEGVLDLHTFRPQDARDVVRDYLDSCREKGILDVRIIHGKGKGVLRRIVHSVLNDRDDIDSFCLASDSGGWGATLVVLCPSSRADDVCGGASSGTSPPKGERCS
jgi:DNA-nicking Smr family endonuclease